MAKLELGVLVIHGMGSQKKGYSKDMRREVVRRMSRKGVDAKAVVWKELFWANALRKRENDLWNTMQSARDPNGDRIPLDWRTVREFVVHNFGDALAYHRDDRKVSAYHEIHEIVDCGVRALKKRLDPPTSPVVVLAHSLGAHIMSNYIWDRQHWSDTKADHFTPINSLLGMVTFGCNIPLLSLSYPVAKPINLPGQNVNEKLHQVSKWLNFLDRDDVLGWPLRPLYEQHKAKLSNRQKETVERIEDHEINVGNFTSSWNPLAHANYWTDDNFTRPVAAYLRRIVTLL